MRQTSPEIKVETLTVEEVEAKVQSLIDGLDHHDLAELLETLQGGVKVEYNEAEGNFTVSMFIQ